MSRVLIAAVVLALTGLCQLTALAASAEPVAVAGTWLLTVETSAGTGTPTLMLEQDGGQLSGTYKGRFGDQKLTGSVTGDAIQFSFTVSGPMGSAEVTYNGVVTGGEMSGTMQMGDMAGGKFTGRKQ